MKRRMFAAALAAVLAALMLLFTGCPEEDKGADEPVTPDPTYGDFATWNKWLEHKYGGEFGWDSGSWDRSPTAPITHDMLAEEYFFSKGLKTGWNLGGTYELRINPRALPSGSLPDGHYDILMPGVKAAGITVIRIPVTWSAGDAGGGGGTPVAGPNALVIPEAWLDNVEAAVEAAHAAGLAVMFNTHHEKNFLRLDLAGQSYRSDGENGADYITYTERFTAIWTQIAARFKDYGDWLMFESMNEPTVTDAQGAVIWDDAPYTAINQVLSKWNQAFVDVVRESGGNNAKRYLVLKAYGGKLGPATTPGNGFSFPVDPAGEGRLAFSFHLYIPNGLALDGSNFTWTSGNTVVYRSNYTNARDSFLAKGIPVFIGETGSTFQSARSGADSVNANKNRLMLMNAIGYYAGIYGIIPCLWDCGRTVGVYADAPNGETLGLFRRNYLVEPDYEQWGLPIDHSRVASVGNGNQTWNVSGNAAYDDPDYGTKVIQAFVDAVDGKTELGKPEYSEKLMELMAANGISY